MTKQFARDFLVGITVMIGLAGLAAMLMIFGEFTGVTQRHYSFTLIVDNAGGLKPNSTVTLSGVKVGSVDSCELLPGAKGVGMVLKIKEGTSIPSAVSVSIDKSFVGETVLDFEVHPDADPGRSIKPGEVVRNLPVQTILSRVNGLIEPSLSRLTRSADGFDRLAATYTTLGERLNEMVEPRTPGDVAEGKSANLRTAIARLDAALAGAEQWLSDENLRGDAKSVIEKAGTVLTEFSTLARSWSDTASTVNSTVGRASEKFTTLAEKADGIADKVSASISRADELLSSARGATEQMTSILEGVNAGKGTLGQLATNPDLYNSLDDAARRLDAALTDLQLLVQKLKAEGVRIGL